jgi:hypothetical protein
MNELEDSSSALMWPLQSPPNKNLLSQLHDLPNNAKISPILQIRDATSFTGQLTFSECCKLFATQK